MRSVLKIALAACVALTPCAPAYGQPVTLAALNPFRPRLTINHDPILCDPFLKAWTQAFDGPDAFGENSIDPAVVYAGAKVSTLPPGRDGFYNTSQQLRIDFDHDGELEVLHFDSYDVGWRYLGVELYLFANEADYQVAAASKEHQQYGSLSFDDNDNPVPGSSYRKLFSYAPIGKAVIIEMSGRVYTLTGPVGRTLSETSPLTVQVVRLDAPGEPQTVCSVDILPAKSTFAAFRDSSPLFRAARDVYGNPNAAKCLGTIGWTAPPLDAVLPTALFRPWAMRMPDPPANEKDEKDWRRTDAARELRYLTWAIEDPQSWRDYLEVKTSRDQFISDMRAYYLDGYAQSEDEAARMADWSWRVVLNTLIYARSPDGYGINQTAWRNDADLPITPDSSPAEIAGISIAAWRDMQANGRDRGDIPELTWRQALLAAVYTRQPMEVVRDLAERNGVRRAHEPSGVDPKSPTDQNLDARYVELLSQLLLASLGHSGLTNYFLERGANPDAGTNEFGKTPLMYAAQHDLLNAVELLIANKVDVNIATQTKKYACVELQRDHRTALMYAAENASPAVIEAILAAGADITAKDTKGNSVLWYFDRNTRITDPSERQRLVGRLSN